MSDEMGPTSPNVRDSQNSNSVLDPFMTATRVWHSSPWPRSVMLLAESCAAKPCK